MTVADIKTQNSRAFLASIRKCRSLLLAGIRKWRTKTAIILRFSANAVYIKLCMRAASLYSATIFTQIHVLSTNIVYIDTNTNIGRSTLGMQYEAVATTICGALAVKSAFMAQIYYSINHYDSRME